ncbi:DUF946 family protein [Perilla frutescens var. frutescens]|nr:DUF946 family protein [Perilla frutescens var. frutescens]
MGNSLNSNVNSDHPLPIHTIFKFPTPLPTWPQGNGGFATGEIDLGGLEVRQITSFDKVWTVNEGGPDNLGATFFEPSLIPDGFSMLGSYAHPNNQPLFGSILVAKTTDNHHDILKQPADYTLITPNDDNSPYFWLPTPPDGYKSLGLLVTASPEKPPLDKIRCVRADFTDEAETETSIWGQAGINVYTLRPKTRGTNAKQLSAGTFAIIQDTNDSAAALPLSCLVNNNSASNSMPNQNQIEAVFKTYAPYIYLHPDETYLPSSVNWYFSNGALLHKKGEEPDPVQVQPNGSNLPQGGTNDGLYWLDLPADEEAGNMVKQGDLESVDAYLHVKPVLGGTCTDIQVWIFYPFNGHATAKLGIFDKTPLGKIGEHVGDWEHVTLRVSNFDGILYRVYFAEHSGGQWVDSQLLEFQSGNKFVGYSSLNGHAMYYKEGVSMQGGEDVGLRNDTAKSGKVVDTGARFSVVAAEERVVEPPWLNYYRKWGPTTSYDITKELEKVANLLPGNLKEQLEKLVDALPAEIFGQDGPTGPKIKNNWNGDEK